MAINSMPGNRPFPMVSISAIRIQPTHVIRNIGFPFDIRDYIPIGLLDIGCWSV